MAINYTTVVRRAYVCQCGRQQESNKFPQKLFIACLHEKFSMRPPEKHQSTPGAPAGTAAKTQTHYRYYTPAQHHDHASAHTNSLPLLFCTFSAPLAVTAAREGREERGRGRREGRRDGRERGPDHPALMAGLSVYICRGSLCNTSGILRPLSPARDVGVGGGEETGEREREREKEGARAFRQQGERYMKERERESGEGWLILLTVSSSRSIAGLWFLNKGAAKNAKCKQSTRRHPTMTLVNGECNREQIHANENFFKCSFFFAS